MTELGINALVGCSNLESLHVGTGLSYLCEWDWSDYKEDPYYMPLLWSSGPTEMENIILENGASSFSMRGYGYYKRDVGYPIFSNIKINYFYIGRPLIDIQTWSLSGVRYNITIKQPYGVIKNLEIGGYCTDVPYFYQSIANLILGEDVETYAVKNIYQGELTSITCKSTTPPTLTGTFDTSTYVNTILYVPKGCKTTYESTEGWKDFWDIIEADVSGIDDIVNSGEVTEVGRYTVSGQKITTPQKGINIVRYSDGTTRKILVQ